jgi:hypothetical protein
LTDPDSDNLKAAAEYLLEVARSSEGRRYRKQPKMDALREYKSEILEARRHGLNIHRIAEIFRERGVDISKIHLMRAIRRFIEEEERASAAQQPTLTKETKSASTNQIVEQPSAVVREEEFAKQLRIARYLAGARLPAVRSLEPASGPKKAKRLHSPAKAAKARPVTKKEKPKQKAEEKELAKERRGVGRIEHKPPLSSPARRDKKRGSPGR